MFDLRYHVASLAAVFLALIIGILVGAGLASRTDVDRLVLQGRIDDLEQRNFDLAAEANLLREQRRAGDEYISASYPVVMNGRLRGTRVALLFIGPSHQDTIDAVEQTLDDASGPGLVELEALELPVDPQEVSAALESQAPGLTLDEVGRRLGQELIAGGETPFWDALNPVLVQDHRGNPSIEADAVVVSHSAVATDAATRRFLDGVYAGLVAASVPVVGIEATESRPSRIAVYEAHNVSSVDAIDTQVGRVALALLLAGGEEGQYGLKSTATAMLPKPIEPLPLAPVAGG